MAHLFIVVVYDSFNRNNVKISKTYNFPDFSFFMSQDDAHYHNHQNAPGARGEGEEGGRGIFHGSLKGEEERSMKPKTKSIDNIL